MSAQIIPLNAAPNQTFSVNLQVDGAALTLKFGIRWNEMAGYWVMSVSNSVGTLLIDSLPLVTGWYPGANVLGQYGYLKIGSCFILNQGNNDSDYPGRNDLGTSWVMLWDDTPAVQEILA